MAGRRLASDADSRANTALAAYLGDLSARLCEPRRHREAILADLRDGLPRHVYPTGV